MRVRVFPSLVRLLIAAGATGLATRAGGATLYVWPDSPSDGPGFAWSNAFHTIQQAVDASGFSGTITVTNGIYGSGGAVTPGGSLPCRVVATRTVKIVSVNGPEHTFIEGAGPVGPGAVRCVYLGGSAFLSGFTLRGGHTRTSGAGDLDRSGGGAYLLSSASLTNCVVTDCRAKDDGGGLWGGSARDCVFRDNVATTGGGARGASLYDCVFEGNYAESGGGLAQGRAWFCRFTGNQANVYGGGVYRVTATDCRIENNLAGWGAGMFGGVALRTHLRGNAAQWGGGGAEAALIQSSAISRNTAYYGGGTDGCTNVQATVAGNRAWYRGGGTFGGASRNSIVYFNEAPVSPEFHNGVFSHVCTRPLAPGEGNIAVDPLLAGHEHIAAISPCATAGSASVATPTDIDGEAWGSGRPMGCDQAVPGALTGPLAPSLVVPGTRVVAGFPIELAAHVSGRPARTVWSAGDGRRWTDRPSLRVSWTTPGSYSVVFAAFNETWPRGVSVTARVDVVASAVHYARPDAPDPVAPYTNRAHAAASLQEAVDACETLGGTVLAGPGEYAEGARSAPGGLLLNRLVVTSAVHVASESGPELTTIRAAGDASHAFMRCVYLANGAQLSGFTLTGGRTPSEGDRYSERSGGAVYAYFSSVSNCIARDNIAHMGGGGVYGGTVADSVLVGNGAHSGGGLSKSVATRCVSVFNWGDYGAGSYGGVVSHSLLSHNTAIYGGGTDGGDVTDCTISDNVAEIGGGTYEGVLSRCVIRRNTGVFGGGCYGGLLTSCLIVENEGQWGGGTYAASLNNATVARNSGREGGGVSLGVTRNTIAYHNTGDNVYGGSHSYCWTIPAQTGEGNSTNDPGFIAPEAGDYRTAPDSACRDSGYTDAAMAAALDLEGRPRVIGPGVDAGAYEMPFDSDLDGLPDWWEWMYGHTLEGLHPTEDPDGDGLSNWDEFGAGTDPSDPYSRLAIRTIRLEPGGLSLTWSGGTGVWSLVKSAPLPDSSPAEWVTVGVLGPSTVPGGTLTGLPVQSNQYLRVLSVR